MVALHDNISGAFHGPGWSEHQARPQRPGFLTLYDLRRSWAGDMRDPFDNLSMFLPDESC
jgi:hypothetical protein